MKERGRKKKNEIKINKFNDENITEKRGGGGVI